MAEHAHVEDEPIDFGPSQAPEITVDPETGQTDIAWPGGKPEAVLLSPEDLEAWAAERNRMLTTIANQNTVLTIVRLGMRPNQSDWESVGLMAVEPEVRIDLMRRRNVIGPRA